MNKVQLLTRIDLVLERGAETLEIQPRNMTAMLNELVTQANPDDRWVDQAKANAFRTAGLAVLQSILGVDHQLYRDFEENTHDKNTARYYKKAFALITALREMVDLGWLDDTRALIAADIFANILEMAAYLLSEGYKDAAAVLAGGSLEGHLRHLCQLHNVDTHYVDKAGDRRPKKAESMNQELYKGSAYSLGDQKQITSWLDLRNDAAHGHYNNYDAGHVKLMLEGVQNFIVRVPT